MDRLCTTFCVRYNLHQVSLEKHGTLCRELCGKLRHVFKLRHPSKRIRLASAGLLCPLAGKVARATSKYIGLEILGSSRPFPTFGIRASRLSETVGGRLGSALLLVGSLILASSVSCIVPLSHSVRDFSHRTGPGS